MADYLLDINHATRLLGESGPLRSRLQAFPTTAASFSLSVTVLAELYYVAYASQRREENLRALHAFVADVIVWPFDAAAAEEFGRIQAEKKVRAAPCLHRRTDRCSCPLAQSHAPHSRPPLSVRRRSRARELVGLTHRLSDMGV